MVRASLKGVRTSALQVKDYAGLLCIIGRWHWRFWALRLQGLGGLVPRGALGLRVEQTQPEAFFVARSVLKEG